MSKTKSNNSKSSQIFETNSLLKTGSNSNEEPPPSKISTKYLPKLVSETSIKLTPLVAKNSDRDDFNFYKVKEVIPSYMKPAKNSPHLSYNSSEEFIPLAAKDSEWKGFKFYHHDENHAKNDNNNLALLTLFPGLKFNNSLNYCSSTTEITKSLIGKKANFDAMNAENKNHKPLQESRNMPNGLRKSIISISTDIDTSYQDNDELEDEPKRSMHVKRRKKVSDQKILPAVSSLSFVKVVKGNHKPLCKLKSNSGGEKKKDSLTSTHSNFADDEGVN